MRDESRDEHEWKTDVKIKSNLALRALIRVNSLGVKCTSFPPFVIHTPVGIIKNNRESENVRSRLIIR